MGLRQLVRVHGHRGLRQRPPPGLPGPHPLLGHLLPRRVRVAGGHTEAVQLPPGAHGGRIHHIQRFLYITVQDLQVLQKDLREAAAHRVPRPGDTLRGHRVSGRAGHAQSEEAGAHPEFLLPPQLDRLRDDGTLRITVRRGFLQLSGPAVLRGSDEGVPRGTGPHPRVIRPDDLHAGDSRVRHRPDGKGPLHPRGQLLGVPGAGDRDERPGDGAHSPRHPRLVRRPLDEDHRGRLQGRGRALVGERAGERAPSLGRRRSRTILR